MKAYFPEVKQSVKYEGPKSSNPLAFKYYDAGKKIGGKTMQEHLRFAVAYWHTFKGAGADIFGAGTFRRPWLTDSDPMKAAEDTLDAAFEFTSKLGAPYYCFHDRDIAPEGRDFAESCKNLDKIVAKAARLQ